MSRAGTRLSDPPTYLAPLLHVATPRPPCEMDTIRAFPESFPFRQETQQRATAFFNRRNILPRAILLERRQQLTCRLPVRQFK